MKKLLYILPVLALVSCENFFDVKQLGNGNYEPSDVRTSMTYTLTEDDLAQVYKKGSVYEQKALSLCTPEDSSAYEAWKQISTLKAFNEAADADIYLPDFMATKFPYLDKGTICKVSYPYYKGKTSRVAPFLSATGYELVRDDYRAIWGGRGAEYLTVTSEKNIPSFLSQKFATATEGKVVVLSYKSLNNDPDTIYPPLPYACTVSDFIAAQENTEHEITGKVGTVKSTTYGRFYIVDTNGRDSIYVYGLSDSEGNNKIWKSLGVQQGDYITIRGIYNAEKGEPQVANAIYVSHSAGILARMPRRIRPAVQDTLYKSVIYQLNNGAWALYENDQITGAFALSQSFYQSYGETSVSDPEISIVKYLTALYPYAKEKDIRLVAYRGKNGMTADEFTFDGTEWVMNTGYTVEEMNFVRQDSWIADISTYYTTPFVNSGLADFTIQHVNLDGLNYVWRYQAAYGATASAYVSGTNHIVEDWLVSPNIRLKKSTNPKMHFSHAVRYGGDYNKEYLKVMVTNNYTGDVTTTEWEHLAFPDSIPDGSNWTFLETGEFDLSKYNNQTIVVAFQYKTTSDELSAPTWEIQNLLIYEPEEEE